MDRLDAISLFTKVVETNSFSEAARQAGRSPSSVSRQMAELEDWLGGRLFYRTTRKITLTEIGRSFHERVRHILLDMEEARVVAGQLEGYASGTVQMTVPASLGAHFTIAINEFQLRWPEIDFILSFSDRVVDLVAEGFDLAVRIGRLQDSILKARKITECRRVLCASPDYLARYGTPQRPSDLSEHSCLTFRSSPGINIWRFREGDQVKDIQVSGRFSADSGIALVQAAELGLGLILAPEWVAGPLLKSGCLQEVLETEILEPETTPIYAVHAFERFVPPKVRLLIEFLVEKFGSNYDWSEPPTCDV